MSQPTVHIVLATYNGERFLKEQLDSLLGQTYKNISIEICDDGSTDATREICQQYCQKDARISLHVNEKNQGYVYNFLNGIKRSRAPYIMLCDQDDIWLENKVEKTLERMQEEEKENPDVPILVYTDAINYDSETGKEMGRFHENSHLNTKKVDTAHLFMENKCIGCTTMVNHFMLSYLDELPDEIRVHDWWLALIASHFGKMVYLPEPSMLYRQHASNMIGGARYGSYVKNRLSKVQEQRLVLVRTYKQGQAFLRCFRECMTPKQIEIAEKFAGLQQAGFFQKRARVISYGFFKSGMVRNIALLILM